MAYFRKDWSTELEVDAGPDGLGAVIVQYNPKEREERHIICFASRLLSEAERRYSQCEKEALAIVWACERFWLYVLGKSFTVVTDNRAAQMIFANTETRNRPPRIERMALRMSAFDCTFVHRPGKMNLADYYSRHPIGKPQITTFLEELKREQYVNIITTNIIPA